MTLTLIWESNTGDALTFGAASGVTIQRGASGLDGAPVINTVEPRVGIDGAALLNTRRPTRPIFLPLFVNESVISTYEVVRLFSAGGTLRADRDGVVRELRDVVYNGGLEGERSGSTGGLNGLGFRKFPLSLVALDPWWYGSIESTSIALGGITPTTFDAAIAFDSEVTGFDGGGTMTFNVEGDTAAFPRFVLTGTLDALAVTSTASNVTWEWQSPLVDPFRAGTVDTRPGNMGPRGGSAFTPKTPVEDIDWTKLSERSQLFHLPVGVNTLVVAPTGADGSADLFVYWEPRWSTP